jgi:electron transport complex protein RnfA
MLFAVFASLSVNLPLQCGLGLRGIAVSQKAGKRPPLAKLGIFFSTVLLLWIVFSYLISSLPLGLFMYVLLFPMSALTYLGLERMVYRFMLRKAPESDGPINSHDGLAATALFITLNIAEGFLEAAILSLGFVLGILLAFVILSEIRRRSTLEATPHFLRGVPLTLISMGLLSLVFSSAALMFFRAIGG